MPRSTHYGSIKNTPKNGFSPYLSATNNHHIIPYLMWFASCSVCKSEFCSLQKYLLLSPPYLLGHTLALRYTFTNSRIYWSRFGSVLYLSLPFLAHLSSFSACISVHLSFFPLISLPWSQDRKWNIRFVKHISLFKCLEMMG